MRKVAISGVKNGSNTAFTITQAPVTGGLVLIIHEGQILKRVLGTPVALEYMLSGVNLTVGTPPESGDMFICYVQISATQSYTQTTFTGLHIPSNVSFTLGIAPPAGSNVLLIKNYSAIEETVASPTATQFNISGTLVTLGVPLLVTDIITAYISDIASALLSVVPLTGSQNGLNTRFVLTYLPPLNYEPEILVILDGKTLTRVVSNPLANQYAFVDTQIIRLGIAPNAAVKLQVFLLGVLQVYTNPYSLTCERLAQRIGIWVQRRADTVELEESVRKVYDEYTQTYQWTFLQIDGTFATEASKTDGTVGVALGSRVVQGTDTAFVASDKGKRFRNGTSDESYEIISVDVTNQKLEIHPAFIGASDTDASYEIFKTIYSLGPEVEYLFSVTSQLRMRETSVYILDRLDPQRVGAGDNPACFAYRGRDSYGNLQIEIYPVPSAPALVRYAGIRRDACTENAHALKGIEALVLNAAAADAMMIIIAKTGSADPWQALAQQYQGKADRVLERLLDLDFTRSGVAQVQGMREDSAFPYDGSYMAEHDTFWLN